MARHQEATAVLQTWESITLYSIVLRSTPIQLFKTWLRPCPSDATLVALA